MLHGKSPFEMIFNMVPNIENLRVFGCLCFAVKLNVYDKLSERSEKSVLTGYSNKKKCYKLYSLDIHSIIFSRDVKFYEDVFMFKKKKDYGGISINTIFLI